MRPALTLALLLSASTSLAGPVITSVTPNSGPVTGGTQVTIKGSGFSDPCAPPKACPVKGLSVYFGDDLAASSTLIDAQTITAVTAAHLPGTFAVGVAQLDGGTQLPNGFTFEGLPEDAFARLLFPIFVGPTLGALGSEFVTTVRLWNKADAADVPLYGVVERCCVTGTYRSMEWTPVPIQHSFTTSIVASFGTPGRILYVPKNSADAVAANLRVADISRTAESAGTEIPVVRDADFRTDSIALLGIPWDANFRDTLRIYSAYSGPAPVVVEFRQDGGTLLSSRTVNLIPGTTVFEPASAAISDFPEPPKPSGSIATLSVIIQIPQPVIAPLPLSYNRIWAFVSSTNNTTQQITIVSP